MGFNRTLVQSTIGTHKKVSETQGFHIVAEEVLPVRQCHRKKKGCICRHANVLILIAFSYVGHMQLQVCRLSLRLRTELHVSAISYVARLCLSLSFTI